MRVTGGQARGLHLLTEAAGVRPAMDRVRAALFSIVGQDLSECRVLDLYAGSGAYGMEALSRGAREVVFVESNRSAIRDLEQNMARLKLPGGVVLPGSVESVIPRLQGLFDLIIADPPYDRSQPGSFGVYDHLLRDPWLPQRIQPQGTLVLETPGEWDAHGTDSWDLLDFRCYGKTGLAFYRKQS